MVIECYDRGLSDIAYRLVQQFLIHSYNWASMGKTPATYYQEVTGVVEPEMPKQDNSSWPTASPSWSSIVDGLSCSSWTCLRESKTRFHIRILIENLI